MISRSVEDLKCWFSNKWVLQWWKHSAFAGFLPPSLLKVTGKHLLSCWALLWAVSAYLGLHIPFPGLLSLSPSSFLWVPVLVLPFPLNNKYLCSWKVWADFSPIEFLNLLIEELFSSHSPPYGLRTEFSSVTSNLKQVVISYFCILPWLKVDLISF